MPDADDEARSGELFDRGLDFITAIVNRLGQDDSERPTPCVGWTVRDRAGAPTLASRTASYRRTHVTAAAIRSRW
jgi:hypothetical protein